MKPEQERLLDELAELLWQREDGLHDLEFIELLLHNQEVSESDYKRIIEIEERVRRYGVEK